VTGVPAPSGVVCTPPTTRPASSSWAKLTCADSPHFTAAASNHATTAPAHTAARSRERMRACFLHGWLRGATRAASVPRSAAALDVGRSGLFALARVGPDQKRAVLGRPPKRRRWRRLGLRDAAARARCDERVVYLGGIQLGIELRSSTQATNRRCHSATSLYRSVPGFVRQHALPLFLPSLSTSVRNTCGWSPSSPAQSHQRVGALLSYR